MFANSRKISSAQLGPHPRLGEVVCRHLRSAYLRMPSEAGKAAFATIAGRLAREPFVLDSGCGTGASTLQLARELPDRLVIGVDKSAARLAAAQRNLALDKMPQNVLLLHCELVDFWQLAAAAGLRCERQLFLYPNPWPKPDHLPRRWHGHPVLPAILALGGEIELRTNWRIYAAEFAQALRLAGLKAHLETITPIDPLTPFERKYAASGHELWRCTAR